jgi:DNA-binding HxlR family transcriptional regulator
MRSIAVGDTVGARWRPRYYWEWSCSCNFCTCTVADEGDTALVRYEQVCPVSLASEVLAERWTPLILREIVLFDRHHFTEIQHGVGRISQSLLSARLRTLEEAGVLERRPNRLGRGWEYHPTRAGRELETVLNQLGIWAQHWIELRREDCDPAYLMQTVHAILRPERLPAAPVTVRFEFLGDAKIYWLVIDGPQPELCYYDPGRESDLVVRVEERALGNVLLGRARLADAISDGAVRLEGRPDLVRSFPSWLGPTRFARYALPAQTADLPISPATAVQAGSARLGSETRTPLTGKTPNRDAGRMDRLSGR